MSGELDVSFIRSATIKMNGLSGVDNEYNFFYDETNNIRKLTIKGAEFNVPDTHNFVLGGIARTEPPSLADANSLMESLQLQKTTKELKLKHIGTGGFQKIIESKKLSIVLKWISSHGYSIHFTNINIVYWSVVDIVDSVIEAAVAPQLHAVNGSLKSDLYELVIDQEQSWLEMLARYNYPNVGKTKSAQFINEVRVMVEGQLGQAGSIREKFLLDFLKLAKSDELVFLDQVENGVLIDSFWPFYAQSFWLFKNSRHVLDQESSIEEILNQTTILENGDRIENYTFVDSESDPHIQIADVITGLIGKLFTYVKDSDDDDIEHFTSSLGVVGSENMTLLRKIMCQTLERSRGFHHHVISENEHMRLNKLVYAA